MKSNQILEAVDQAVSALLSLRWCRVGDVNTGSIQPVLRNTQVSNSTRKMEWWLVLLSLNIQKSMKDHSVVYGDEAAR